MDDATLRLMAQEREASRMGATSYTALTPRMRLLVDDAIAGQFGQPEAIQWIEARIPDGYADMSPGMIAQAMHKRGIRYVPSDCS